MQSEVFKLDPWTKSFYLVEKDFLPIEINCSNVVGIVQSCVTFL